MEEKIVNNENEGLRLDKYLSNEYPSLSRVYIKKLIDEVIHENCVKKLPIIITMPNE